MNIFKRLFKRETDWGATMVMSGQDYVLYWEKNKKTGEQRFVGQTRKEVGSPEEVMKKINDALGNKPLGSGSGGSGKFMSTGKWSTPSEDRYEVCVRGSGGFKAVSDEIYTLGELDGLAITVGEPTTLWEPLYVIDSIPYTANAGGSCGSSVHDRANLKPTGLVWNRENGQVKKEKGDER